MVLGVYNIRLARWQNLIYEANINGMKKVDWCRMHGITITTNSSITDIKK